MTPPAAAPDEVRRLELATRRLVRDLVAGDYASAFRGRGLEFSEVREYHPGDEVRSIDWRVTARLGVPYVRRYEEERELTLVLAVDASASGHVGSRLRTKGELAAEVAAVLALAAVRHHDRVGLAFLTDRLEHFVEPRKGKRHALRVISDVLSRQGEARRTDLEGALAGLALALPPRAVVILLSDLQADGYEIPLARIAAKHEVVVLQLTDALEQALPDAGLVEFWDPESGERRLVDTGNPALRELLRARQHDFNERASHHVRSAGADLVRLDASQPYADTLVHFFRRRARR
jgi:uncharacterized protein (DUF58 family)